MGFANTHRLRVRYSECDMQGHVFNGHWLTYFDLAATELWRAAIGSWNEVTGRGIDLMVAEANVSYRAPARFDDEIAITAAVERLGTSSIVTAFAATRAESEEAARGEAAGPVPGGAAARATLLVDGRLVHVVVDARTFAKTAIPDWVREALG